LDVELIDLLTMGGIIPTPGTVLETAANWLRNLPLPILTMMFRPLMPLSTDRDWIDVDTAVKTILGSLPLQQISQFFQWVSTVFDPFKGIVEKLIEVLAGILVNPGGILQPVADFIHSLLKVSEWKTWLTTIFQPVADGLVWVSDIVSNAVNALQDLLDGLFGIFGGTAGAGKTVTETLAVITGWLAGPFKALADGLASIVTTVRDLVDGIFSMFSGTTGVGKTVAESLAAVADWLGGAFKAISDGVAAITSTVQSLLDAIFSLFGGTVGTGKNVTEAITALTGWLTGPFKALADLVQRLMDAIAGFKPGGIATGVVAGITDVIDAIGGILGVGQAAQASADHANIGLAAIKAEQAGGFSDEFNYPTAATLPAPWTVIINDGDATQAGTYGPNNSGVVVWKPAGLGHRRIVYRRDDKPILVADCTVTLVLAKPPIGLNSFVFVCAQMSLSDKSHFRARIAEQGVTFQTCNAAGVETNLGSEVRLPSMCKAGDVLELKLAGTTATVLRNGVQVATRTYTPLAGRHIGFGADVSSGLLASPADFAGIAWHG